MVLHNILISQYQGQHCGQQPGDDDDVPGDCGLIGGSTGASPDRIPAGEAKRQRDYLKDYFNNEGAVAWQWAWCVVDVTAASCCLGESKHLWSGSTY